MKINFYTKYTRLGASSRVRMLQFIPKLQQKFEIKYFNLLPDEYIISFNNNNSQSKLLILFSYLKRFYQIMCDKSDVLYIEKELFPYMPYFIEYIFLRNRRYIIDIDDAVFHNYDQSDSVVKRKLLGNKFRHLFVNSDAVLAGSPYLVDYAKSCFAPNVIYYPTVIELDRYIKLSNETVDVSNNTIVIGWIGTRSTDKYLEIVTNAIEEVASKFPHLDLLFRIVGSDRKFNLTNVFCENITWSESKEVELIDKFDIGIMPLIDSKWERGKCAYKLIQYMACAKPVIASNVGANSVVVDDGVSGYLCSTHDDWVNSFTNLIASSTLRHKMGICGLERVRQRYSVDKNIEMFNEVINDLMVGCL